MGKTGKQVLSLLLCIVMLATLLPRLQLPVRAVTEVVGGTCGENVSWSLSEAGTLIIRGSGRMYHYTYEGSPWYDYRLLINNVVIQSGVTSIGSFAFKNCSRLTRVTIGDSVTSIGSDAFSGCSRLTRVTIGDSVTSIGSSAFSGCSSLTSVIIPDSVVSIGSSAFYYCSSLTSVTIPDSVTGIGRDAFYYCGLTDVYITDLVAWCKINFNNNTSNPLGNNCNLYLNGDLVTNLTIPDSVTSIGKYAFYDCGSLTSVTIPDGVDSIGQEAFYSCSSLAGITIPDSVVSIGICAFYNCSSLTSITFLGEAPSFGQNCFSKVTAAAYYPCNDETWTSFMKMNYGGSLTWKVKHTLGEDVITQEATCTQDAAQSGTCQRCGTPETKTFPNTATGHTFGEDGFCINCGYLTDIIIDMTDSRGDGWNGAAIKVYADDELLTTSTISSGSSAQVTIPYIFGKTYTFRWINGTANSECSFKITMNNEVRYSCAGTPHSRVFFTLENTCSHQYDTVITPPTCTGSGVTSYTCRLCGEKKSETVPATGHTEETVPGYAATCTETGLTDGVKCTVCDVVLTAQQTIPATGHDNLTTEVAPTCTEYGYDFHQCQVCGYHSYDHVTFPTGHSYQPVVTPPTCTEEGFTTYTCSGCSDAYIVDRRPLTAHHYEDGTCTGCGKEKPAILSGDVNCDGERTIADVARIYSHVTETLLLDSVSMAYADVNGDDTVDIADTARLYAHIKGTNPLD